MIKGILSEDKIVGVIDGEFSCERYYPDLGNYYCSINNIIANKKVFIRDSDPTINHGGYLTFAAGEKNDDAIIYRTLVNFDFSSIPDSCLLENVNIKIYRSADLASNTRKIQVYRMKRSWVEGSGTQPDPSSDGATWNTYDGTHAWTAVGAFDPNDCEQIPIGEYEIEHDMANGWIEIPLNITSKDELTLSYGFLLKMETEDDDCHVFTTEDHDITLQYDVQGVINGVVSPLFDKDVENNPLFTGAFGSIVYESKNTYSFFYGFASDRYLHKRTSANKTTWGDPSTIFDAGIGNDAGVPTVWKEGEIYYMLFRSNKWGTGDFDIGLATSLDGNTWDEEATNPVITQTDIGAWATGNIDPWGIIKIGSTYYLWVNDISEVPRQTGLATSIDLINWTMNPNNPIFDNGRYCISPIKYSGKYYMFVPYTPEGNVVGASPIRYRIELYRDLLGTFLPDNREFLGNILLGGEDGDWDDDYLDTPSILTTSIQRDILPHNMLYMYYTGHSGSTWTIGLAIKEVSIIMCLEAITEPEAEE